MGLNIKNERVHRLAREAARRTGATQTSVIETALVRYLASLDSTVADRDDRLDSLLRSIDARLTDDDREAIRHDLSALYDDRGLPS